MFYDAEGRPLSLLASWTDVGEPDVFIQVAAGRSFVRPDDLATLLIKPFGNILVIVNLRVYTIKQTSYV